MQSFCNVATLPERKTTKSTGKVYWEFRAAESQRGDDKDPTWLTVRVMKEDDPGLAKGDFVRVTGKLKTDVYTSREGKPMCTLVMLAFEAAKLENTPKTEEKNQIA